MSIIRPTKAASMLSAATSFWLSKETTWCGSRVTRLDGMLQRCDDGLNRQLTIVWSEPPPHPQPFSPAARASTTRPRRGGEGSQNEEEAITPNTETTICSRQRLNRPARRSEIASTHTSQNLGPDREETAPKQLTCGGGPTQAAKSIFFVRVVGPASCSSVSSAEGGLRRPKGH